MTAHDAYLLWLAAMARGDYPRACGHAGFLLWLMTQGEHPQWTAEAKHSFMAWSKEAFSDGY